MLVQLQQPKNLTTIFDVMRRRKPNVLLNLIELHPDIKAAALGERILGEKIEAEKQIYGSEIRLLYDILEPTLSESRLEINEIALALTSRVKTLARIKFASGIITAFSTAGVVAVMFQDDNTIKMVIALIAFVSAVMTLLSTYISELSGGTESLPNSQKALYDCASKHSEAEATFRLAKVSNDYERALLSLNILNSVLASCQMIRVKLGMRI